MRLDKYLKISRIIKRRSIAKEISDKGRVTINDKIAKSSSNVNVGDILSITFGDKLLTLRIDLIKDTTKKSESDYMYTIISEKSKKNLL